METLKKLSKVVISLSMIITITVGALSIIGVAITGFYPGIIVLLIVTLVPIASRFHARKITSKSIVFQRNHYITLIMVNLLSILMVLWMTFVIVIDRVFPNI